jgi:phosphatidylserine/phosphatidylglycerophosphate/cardiolipin synthase-like enzyme
MPWFRAFLDKALGDARVTRAESRDLRDLLQENGPDADRLALYRSQLFDVIEQRVGNDAAERARLRFVEDVMRALARYEAAERGAVVQTEALFFPSEQAHDRLLDILRGVQRTLDICVFTITDDRVVGKIESAIARGARVRVISDDDKSEDRGSDVERIAKLGAEVRLDDDPEHMHHKFAVLDGERLLTGSYNWTRSAANRNRENILFTDEPRAVSAYAAEFERLWTSYRRR